MTVGLPGSGLYWTESRDRQPRRWMAATGWRSRCSSSGSSLISRLISREIWRDVFKYEAISEDRLLAAVDDTAAKIE